ncbi:MAG: hypothetical protein R2727_12220 [Bacteroidales bacterium]
MDYYVTPHFRVGASVTTINGYNPLNTLNPYSYGYRSPFYY